MKNRGHVEVYLSFDGNCKEVLHFYKDAFGGEITSVMEWNEMPSDEGFGEVGDEASEASVVSEAGPEGADALAAREDVDMPQMPDDAILHASLKIGDTTIMMSDNPYMNTTFGDHVTLNWSHADEAEVRRVWQVFLDAGAEVEMDLEPSFFAPLFGAIRDHFGVTWQIMIWEPEA